MKIHRRVKSFGYYYVSVRDKQGNEIDYFQYRHKQLPHIGSFIINNEKSYVAEAVLFQNDRMMTCIWARELT
jgi:hypothetical protein